MLTAALGAAAALLMAAVGFTEPPDPIIALSGWAAWSILSTIAVLAIHALRLLLRGEKEPIAALRSKVASEWRRYVTIALAMTLAGLDVYFFMLVKPQLNALFPFWADGLLADLDALIFGRDPWRLFAGWDLDPMAFLYAIGWYLVLLATVFWLLLKPPSAAKGTALLAYFATWSVFGPMGQALLSSAGPIFYERIGLGARFAEMPVPPLASMVSDYLWAMFQERSLAQGAGISAMPSLHVATMAWAVMAFASFRSTWTIPASLFALYIYAGSIALGWHYATDGLVGAAGAGLCFYLSRLYLDRNARHAARIGPPAVEAGAQ